MEEYDILIWNAAYRATSERGKGERGEKSVCLNWNGWGLDLTVRVDRHTHARSMTRNQTQKCILRHIRESGEGSRPKKCFFVCHMIRR